MGRRFKEPRRRGARKDVDGIARAYRFKIFGWALFAGLPLGGFAGYAMGQTLLGLVLGPVLIWGFAAAVAGLASKGATFLFVSSGSSAPRRKEYSRAEALSVGGDHRGAIAAYQEAILEDPTEGEAYLRIARILRDRLNEPEEALSWFRRALQEAKLARGWEMLARREICEVLMHRLEEPRRAAPDLARLAEAYPDTSAGAWAKGELARIKEEMADQS